MTIHCDKHTRFIPRCNACELLKLKNTTPNNIESDIYKEAYNVTQSTPIKETRTRPKDPATGRTLFDGRKYERVFVPQEKLTILEYFFIDAESWGYEHYVTIPNVVRGELILMFKKMVITDE